MQIPLLDLNPKPLHCEATFKPPVCNADEMQPQCSLLTVAFRITMQIVKKGRGVPERETNRAGKAPGKTGRIKSHHLPTLIKS